MFHYGNFDQLVAPSLVTSLTIWQVSTGVMKVCRFHVNIGVEGNLVVENRAASVMGQVEQACKNVMIDIFRYFLQGNDMPPACNLLCEGIFFSASAPRVPVVDAEPLLHR